MAKILKNLSLVISIAGLLLSGCSSTGAKTANVVNCAPQEVVISNFEIGVNTVTWSASCRGKDYYCWRSSFQETECKEKN